MESDTIPPKPKRASPRRRQPISPEAGSLWGILCHHSGKSLFVPPICWTELHKQLLRCRFAQLPAQRSPRPSSSPSPSPRRSHQIPPTVVKIGRELDILFTVDGSYNTLIKTRSMRTVLSTLFPTHLSGVKVGSEMDLRFGNRAYRNAVRCQSLWKKPDSTLFTTSFDSTTTLTSSRSASQLFASMTVDTSNDAPILAYVSRSHLNHIRKNCFRVMRGPNRALNEPVYRLQSLRSKILIPKNPDEDQFFVAVMIAMAQQAVYGDVSRGTDFAPRDVEVRLLTLSEGDSSFLVYTATVPAALLMMFHEPHKAPQGNTELDINFTQVPVWPVLGLKERLGKALGSDIVGDFQGVSIDTYEDELAETTPEVPSPKRRREALSEVFNASFSEDRELERPSEILGKRRCLEEGRVGVVR
ncbi:hypothetical protein F4778DRAFT_259525 [Xylariomycetidae sp. FL2044]|nr:hypothetical protein F4778DRAFT_259525 [Xylariomycetidae sp. FL2044]